MPKVTLSEFASTKDPLLDDNFEFLIAKPPVGGSEYARALRIMCKTGVKPGANLDEVIKEAFGYQIRYAAGKKFTGTMSTEYNENSEMMIYKSLEDWVNLIRDTDNGTGSFKEKYAVKATMRIFKQDGSVAAEYEIFGVWPKTIPDLTFSGSGQALQVQIEWSYDYVKRVR